MSTLFNNWNALTLKNTTALNPAVQQLHHATQFIAMAAQSYLPHKEDDSHTNAEWLPKKESTAGHWIKSGNRPFRVAVHYPDFTLRLLLEDGSVAGSFPLGSRTFEEAESWLRGQLSAFGLEGSKLERIQHYNLPNHPIQKGESFQQIDSVLLKELATWRTNAYLLLQQFASKFEEASPVRTWPHHFDTGSYIPVAFDNNGEAIKSIGIGWAIADDGINEPYWYVNHWRKNEKLDYTNMPNLPKPAFWQGEQHPMAALRTSDVLQSDKKQGQLVEEFLKTAIHQSLHLIGEKGQGF